MSYEDPPARLAVSWIDHIPGEGNLTGKEVTLCLMGGSQPERYQAMLQDVVQAVLVTPSLDARGKKDGFPILYNLNDLGLQFIYSSLHTNSKLLATQRDLVQRFVAAMAESVYFVEKNPDKAKASLGRELKLSDPDSLESAYNAYARLLVNRRMVAPARLVTEAVDIARETGTKIKRSASELFDNGFAEELDKNGFLRELWGAELR